MRVRVRRTEKIHHKMTEIYGVQCCLETVESVHSASMCQLWLWPDYAYRDEAANTFLIVIFNKWWSVHWAAQSLENTTLKFSPNTFAVLIFLINGSYKDEQIKQD